MCTRSIKIFLCASPIFASEVLTSHSGRTGISIMATSTNKEDIDTTNNTRDLGGSLDIVTLMRHLEVSSWAFSFFHA